MASAQTVPSSSASTRGAPHRHAPYSTHASERPHARQRRRVSSLVVEPALDALGAVYVGWAQGERDPAPLCCPERAKQTLVRKYGNAAVGSYSDSTQSVGNSTTSVNAGAKQPHLNWPDPSAGPQQSAATEKTHVPLCCPQVPTAMPVPIGRLPPLPPAPSQSHYVGPAFDFLPCARIEPTLALPPLAPQPSFDAFSLPSTPPEVTTAAPAAAALPAFDACEFLDASLALFQSASQPPSPILLLPSLPNLDMRPHQQAQQPLPPPPPPPQFSFDMKDFAAIVPLRKLETVPEDEYDESLFSSGESAIGSSSATDVMSEAGWAW